MKDKDRYWDCLDQAMEASHGGRTEEALAWLDEALKAHPDGAEARNGRGEILWDEGKIDEALAEFETSAKADPKFVTAHLNRTELLVEEFGAFEEAIDHCDRLLAAQAPLPRLDHHNEAEVYYLKSKALFYQDDLDGALFLVRRALKTAGEIAIYRSFEGQILFEQGRFEDARGRLERSVAIEPDAPHALYHFGLVLERLGREDEAERALTQANALAPDQYPLATVISESEFERAAADAIGDLPRSIREYVEGIPILIEDFPAKELIGRENVSPQILGIFIGTPRTQFSVEQQPTDLDQIILFRRNLEKICADRDQLIEQIQITVKHEVGHYLGLDEDDLERLGLA